MTLDLKLYAAVYNRKTMLNKHEEINKKSNFPKTEFKCYLSYLKITSYRTAVFI